MTDRDRLAPHDVEYRLSRASRDRVRGKPTTLRALLAWGKREYLLEPPDRLHNHSLAEDGDPTMNAEAAGYLGFHQGEVGGAWLGQNAQPNDWTRIACRTDRDGLFVTPMRCAIARSAPGRRPFLRDLLSHVLHFRDVTRQHGVADDYAGDVVFHALSRLWDTYTVGPIPDNRRTGYLDKSDAQRAAEDA